jgi:ABC-2 type transport system permease protein
MTDLQTYLNRRHPKTLWRSVSGLAYREIRRFGQVPAQTLVFPILTILLYYLIFFFMQKQGLRGTPSDSASFSNISFLDFLSAGLIAKECISAAYSNPTSSLMQAKLVGNYVDLLIAPLGALGIWSGFIIGALVRTMIVFAVAYITVSLLFLDHFPMASFPLLLYSFLVTAISMGSFGLATAIVSQTFDHVTLIMIVFFQPFLYLGGVFFSVDILPSFFKQVTYLNPFFYIVNLFRASILGESDISQGLLLLFGALSCLFWVVIVMFVLCTKKIGLRK